MMVLSPDDLGQSSHGGRYRNLAVLSPGKTPVYSFSSDILHVLGVPDRKTWKDAFANVARRPYSYIPYFNMLDLKDSGKVLSAARAVQRGEATPEQEEYLNTFLADQQRTSTTAYKMWDIALRMPAYALEFVSIGGIIKGAAKGTLMFGSKRAAKGVTKKLLKGALKRSIEASTAKAVVRAGKRPAVRSFLKRRGTQKLATLLAGNQTDDLAEVGGKWIARKKVKSLGSLGALADTPLGTYSGTMDAAIRRDLGRAVGDYSKYIAASAVPRTMLQPHRVANRMIQNLTPKYALTEDEQGAVQRVLLDEGDGFGQALAKAFGDIYIENLSEQTGEMFFLLRGVGGPYAKQAMKLAYLDKAAEKLSKMKGLAPGSAFRRILSNHFLGGEATATGRFLRRAGWQGVLNELGEEVVGGALRQATGIEPLGLPTFDETVATALGFMINPLAISSASLEQGMDIYHKMYSDIYKEALKIREGGAIKTQDEVAAFRDRLQKISDYFNAKPKDLGLIEKIMRFVIKDQFHETEANLIGREIGRTLNDAEKETFKTSMDRLQFDLAAVLRDTPSERLKPEVMQSLIENLAGIRVAVPVYNEQGEEVVSAEARRAMLIEAARQFEEEHGEVKKGEDTVFSQFMNTELMGILDAVHSTSPSVYVNRDFLSEEQYNSMKDLPWIKMVRSFGEAHDFYLEKAHGEEIEEVTGDNVIQLARMLGVESVNVVRAIGGRVGTFVVSDVVSEVKKRRDFLNGIISKMPSFWTMRFTPSILFKDLPENYKGQPIPDVVPRHSDGTVLLSMKAHWNQNNEGGLSLYVTPYWRRSDIAEDIPEMVIDEDDAYVQEFARKVKEDNADVEPIQQASATELFSKAFKVLRLGYTPSNSLDLSYFIKAHNVEMDETADGYVNSKLKQLATNDNASTKALVDAVKASDKAPYDAAQEYQQIDYHPDVAILNEIKNEILSYEGVRPKGQKVDKEPYSMSLVYEFREDLHGAKYEAKTRQYLYDQFTRAAGWNDEKQFVRDMIDRHGRAIVPYLTQFFDEIATGTIRIRLEDLHGPVSGAQGVRSKATKKKAIELQKRTREAQKPKKVSTQARTPAERAQAAVDAAEGVDAKQAALAERAASMAWRDKPVGDERNAELDERAQAGHDLVASLRPGQRIDWDGVTWVVESNGRVSLVLRREGETTDAHDAVLSPKEFVAEFVADRDGNVMARILPDLPDGRLAGTEQARTPIEQAQAAVDAAEGMEAKQAALEKWKRENPEAVLELGFGTEPSGTLLREYAPSWLKGDLLAKWSTGEMSDDQVVSALLEPYRRPAEGAMREGGKRVSVIEDDTGRRSAQIDEVESGPINVSQRHHMEAVEDAREGALQELADTRRIAQEDTPSPLTLGPDGKLAGREGEAEEAPKKASEAPEKKETAEVVETEEVEPVQEGARPDYAAQFLEAAKAEKVQAAKKRISADLVSQAKAAAKAAQASTKKIGFSINPDRDVADKENSADWSDSDESHTGDGEGGYDKKHARRVIRFMDTARQVTEPLGILLGRRGESGITLMYNLAHAAELNYTPKPNELAAIDTLLEEGFVSQETFNTAMVQFANLHKVNYMQYVWKPFTKQDLRERGIKNSFIGSRVLANDPKKGRQYSFNNSENEKVPGLVQTSFGIRFLKNREAKQGLGFWMVEGAKRGWYNWNKSTYYRTSRRGISVKKMGERHKELMQRYEFLRSRKRGQDTFYLYLGKFGDKDLTIFVEVPRAKSKEDLKTLLQQYKERYESADDHDKPFMVKPDTLKADGNIMDTYRLNVVVNRQKVYDELFTAYGGFKDIADYGKRLNQIFTPGIAGTGQKSHKFIIFEDNDWFNGEAFLPHGFMQPYADYMGRSVVDPENNWLIKAFLVYKNDQGQLINIKPMFMDLDAVNDKKYPYFQTLRKFQKKHGDIILIPKSSAKVIGFGEGEIPVMPLTELADEGRRLVIHDRKDPSKYVREFDGQNFITTSNFNYDPTTKLGRALKQKESIELFFDGRYLGPVKEAMLQILDMDIATLETSSFKNIINVTEDETQSDDTDPEFVTDNEEGKFGNLKRLVNANVPMNLIMNSIEGVNARRIYARYIINHLRNQANRVQRTLIGQGMGMAQRGSLGHDAETGRNTPAKLDTTLSNGIPNSEVLSKKQLLKDLRDERTLASFRARYPYLFRIENMYLTDSINEKMLIPVDENDPDKVVIMGDAALSVRVPSSGVAFLLASYFNDKLPTDSSMVMQDNASNLAMGADFDGDQQFIEILIREVKDGVVGDAIFDDTKAGLLNRIFLTMYQANLDSGLEVFNYMKEGPTVDLDKNNPDSPLHELYQYVEASKKRQDEDFPGVTSNDGQWIIDNINTQSKQALSIAAAQSPVLRYMDFLEIPLKALVDSKGNPIDFIISEEFDLRVQRRPEDMKFSRVDRLERDSIIGNLILNLIVDDIKDPKISHFGWNKHTVPLLYALFAGNPQLRTVPQFVDFIKRTSEFFKSELVQDYVSFIEEVDQGSPLTTSPFTMRGYKVKKGSIYYRGKTYSKGERIPGVFERLEAKHGKKAASRIEKLSNLSNSLRNLKQFIDNMYESVPDLRTFNNKMTFSESLRLNIDPFIDSSVLYENGELTPYLRKGNRVLQIMSDYVFGGDLIYTDTFFNIFEEEGKAFSGGRSLSYNADERSELMIKLAAVQSILKGKGGKADDIRLNIQDMIKNKSVLDSSGKPVAENDFIQMLSFKGKRGIAVDDRIASHQIPYPDEIKRYQDAHDLLPVQLQDMLAAYNLMRYDRTGRTLWAGDYTIFMGDNYMKRFHEEFEVEYNRWQNGELTQEEMEAIREYTLARDDNKNIHYSPPTVQNYPTAVVQPTTRTEAPPSTPSAAVGAPSEYKGINAIERAEEIRRQVPEGSTGFSLDPTQQDRQNPPTTSSFSLEPMFTGIIPRAIYYTSPKRAIHNAWWKIRNQFRSEVYQGLMYQDRMLRIAGGMKALGYGFEDIYTGPNAGKVRVVDWDNLDSSDKPAEIEIVDNLDKALSIIRERAKDIGKPSALDKEKADRILRAVTARIEDAQAQEMFDGIVMDEETGEPVPAWYVIQHDQYDQKIRSYEIFESFDNEDDARDFIEDHDLSGEYKVHKGVEVKTTSVQNAIDELGENAEEKFNQLLTLARRAFQHRGRVNEEMREIAGVDWIHDWAETLQENGIDAHRYGYMPHVHNNPQVDHELASALYRGREESKRVERKKFLTYLDAARIKGLEPADMNAANLVGNWYKDIWGVAVNRSMITLGSTFVGADLEPLWIPRFTQAKEDSFEVESAISDEHLEVVRDNLENYLNSLLSREASEKGYAFHPIKLQGDTARQQVENMVNQNIKLLNRHGYVETKKSQFRSIGNWLVKEDAGPDGKTASRVLKMLEEPVERQSMTFFGYKANWLNGISRFNNWSKNAGLSLSAFHPASLIESLIAMGGLSIQNWAKLNPFMIRKNIARLNNIRKQAMVDPTFTKMMISHGMTVDFSNPNFDQNQIYKDLQAVKGWAKNSKLPGTGYISKAAGVWEKYNQWMNTWLWGALHPTVKLASAQAIYNELKENARLHNRKFDDGEVMTSLAKLMNDGFGGQNWDQYIWATPKTRQWLHLLFFAPDWTLSAFNVAGASNLPIVSRAIREDQSPLQMRLELQRYWPAMAIMVMTVIPQALQFVIWGLSKALPGPDDEDDTPFIFMNEPGKEGRAGLGGHIDLTPLLRKFGWVPFIGYEGEPTGKRRVYLRFAKQANEVFEGWAQDFSRTLLNKTSAAVRTVFEQMTETNTAGWELGFKDQGYSGWLFGEKGLSDSRLSYIGRKFLPMSILAPLEGRPTTFFAPSSRGMTMASAQTRMAQVLTAYAEDDVWAKVNSNPKYIRNLKALGPEILEAAERNGLDSEVVLTAAKRKTLAHLYSDFFKYLNKEQYSKLDRVAKSIIRVNGTTKNLEKSMKKRMRESKRRDLTLAETTAIREAMNQ
jgi:hypothetical protein